MHKVIKNWRWGRPGNKVSYFSVLVNGRSDILAHAVRLDQFQLPDARDKGQSGLDLSQRGNLMGEIHCVSMLLYIQCVLNTRCPVSPQLLSHNAKYHIYMTSHELHT